MQKQSEDKEIKEAIETIVEAIRNKKGSGILDINISKISTTICRHFVICDAQSHIQVQAIADEIDRQMAQVLGRKNLHKEGYQNGIWILLDYIDIVVHVFQSEARQFYNLEELWGDGQLKKFKT